MAESLSAWIARVPWLQNLPPTWRVERFGLLATLSANANVMFDERLLSLSATRGIIPKTVEGEHLKRSGEELKRYWRVKREQLVVNPMWLAHGSVAVSNCEGVISPDYRVYDIGPELDPRFIHHLLQTREYRTLYELFVRGDTTYDRRVSKDDFHGLPIVVPPRHIQGSVAAFLDRKTVAIDALITKKERMIELLHEKRQALITQAVTKGLDANVLMKDSGVDWLGSVPAQWSVRRLRHIGFAIIGLTFAPSDVTSDGTGVLVLRASNVRNGRVVLDDALYVNADIPPDLITRSGDILICSRSGSADLIGKSAMITADTSGLSFGAFMTVLRSPINPYLFFVFNSNLFAFQTGAFRTSTINQLTVSTLKDFSVPLPPEGERNQITAYLTTAIRRIDNVIEKMEHSAAVLRDYRQALVSAAVTGKIDIRTEDAA